MFLIDLKKYYRIQCIMKLVIDSFSHILLTTEVTNDLNYIVILTLVALYINNMCK